MSRAVKKVLNISLEYTDIDEVQMALHKMQMALHSGKRYERVTYLSSIIEWSCMGASEMEYTEKVINGQLCQVYQSKINN